MVVPSPTPPSAAVAAEPDPPWITAASPSVRDVVASVAALPVRVWARRALVAGFVRRELAARTRGALLGRAWPLLQPLAIFAAYFVVFTRVLGLRADALGASEGELAASMFVGALAWTSLAEALTRSATSIGEHAELVKKVPFAAEILPLQRCLVALTTALLGAAVFVLARLAVTRDLGALAQLAWLAPTVVVHATLCFGLGLLAAALQVLVRDVVHALTLGLSLAMLVTPVFWIADARALPAVAPYLPWVDLNPLHHLMSAWRVALSCELAQVSIPRSLAIAGAWALVALFAGACTFSIAQRRFADEV